MKTKYILIVLLLFFVFSMQARMRENTLTAGFELGTLMDINAKYHSSEYIAWEVFFSPNPDNWVLLGVGWKIHITNLFDFELDLNFVYGLEAHFFSITGGHHPLMGYEKDADELGVSLLASLGFTYFPDEIPFEFHTSIGPGITSTPSAKIFVHFVFGVRFHIWTKGKS